MDGFHLADAELERLGRRDRKGAIDTFDAYGYLAVLQRIRAQTGEVVYAPAFDRHIEQPIAGSIAVPPDARLVVTEGNYLLDDDPPWPSVRKLLSEVWFIDVPREERHRRLVARHVEFGKSPEQAEAWVTLSTNRTPNASNASGTRPTWWSPPSESSVFTCGGKAKPERGGLLSAWLREQLCTTDLFCWLLTLQVNVRVCGRHATGIRTSLRTLGPHPLVLLTSHRRDRVCAPTRRCCV